MDPFTPWGNPYEVETDIVYPGGTCLPEAFTIYISIDSDFKGENWNLFSPGPGNVYTSNPEGLLLVEDDSNDVLDCTTYYWRAWGMVGDTDGPFNETFSFYTDIEGKCFIPLKWKYIPYIKAPQDTNCRASDYTASQNFGTLFEGEEAEVLAVNPEGTHVMIKEPSTNVSCWVWLDLVDLMLGSETLEAAQLLDLVAVENPATPTATPTFTPEPIRPECSDGLDNDGDGFVDLVDRECRDASDNDEANP